MTLSDLSTGKLLEINQSFSELTGYSSQEAIGKTSIELAIVSTEQRNANIATVKELGYLKNQEVVITTKDGKEKVALISIEIIQVAGIKKALTILHDITERKEAEKKIRISEEKFYKTFQMSAAGMTLSDYNSGNLLEINQSFRELLGYSQQEVEGKTPVELGIISSEQREVNAAFINKDGYLKNQEIVLFTKTGKEKVVLLSIEIMEVGNQKWQAIE